MKAGLEVHQQLATSKLFCGCPVDLSDSVLGIARRRLQATSGEDHQVDAAAEFQAGRGLTYEYEIVPSSCLVELDEEPPHALNPAALEVALTMALLLHARPLDEVEVMRKIVVDGSNTSGFQRTALVAVNGRVEARGKTYSIPSICLEEDAARKVGESKGVVRYRLDRLGVPLIEIATGPEITSGPEAREVAEEIGALLRATRKVRRGIGTIREDLNVSTQGGNRVEIKGVQELRLIHRYADLEEERQRLLLKVRDALRKRGAEVPREPSVDVGDLLSREGTGPLGELIRQAAAIRAVRLLGFHGLLGPLPGSEERLGRELAEQARSAGLRGLLHSDELPGFGISAETVEAVRKHLELSPADAFVVVAAPSVEIAEAALERIRRRARAALEGVPAETRDPLPDGRTRYSRPLPGRDRMYPETDVPPIVITAEHLDRLRSVLPERPEVTRQRLKESYTLSEEIADQIAQLGEVDRFELLVGRGHSASSVARLLTQELPAVDATTPGGSLERVSTETLADVLGALGRAEFSKEALPQILRELTQHGGAVAEAARRIGINAITRAELEAITERIIDRNADLMRQRGGDAFSPLMGDVMKEVRGRRDGKEVADVLRLALARRRGEPPNSG